MWHASACIVALIQRLISMAWMQDMSGSAVYIRELQDLHWEEKLHSKTDL